jgi:hypothetical protein
LLSAVAPEQVALALAAADEVTTRRAHATRAGELAVDRARYHAQRAERAFTACEPENRLVARSLEDRWEARLNELTEAEAALATQLGSQPPLPDPDRLAATVADLPALWNTSSTTDRDRKRLLRTLLADVTITASAHDPTRLDIGLHWISGATQSLPVTRHRNAIALRRTDPQAITLARQVGADLDNTALAAALNTAGHTTGTGQPFTADSAGNLRHYHRIAYPGLLTADERTPRQIAEHLDISTSMVHHWITTGILPARRGPGNRWCVPFGPDVEAACRDLIASSGHQHTDIDPRPRSDDEYSIAEVAERLGVKPDVIYTWTQQCHLSARRGSGARLWIWFTPRVEAACLRRIVQSYKLPADVKAKAQQRLERNAL